MNDSHATRRQPVTIQQLREPRYFVRSFRHQIFPHPLVKNLWHLKATFIIREAFTERKEGWRNDDFPCSLVQNYYVSVQCFIPKPKCLGRMCAASDCVWKCLGFESHQSHVGCSYSELGVLVRSAHWVLRPGPHSRVSSISRMFL